MKISIIVGMDTKDGIGRKNELPWKIPSDLKRFKALTMGHHLIIGRKTFDSIGRVLPGRTMVIITRQVDFQPDGCLVAHTLAEALLVASERGESEAFIGGGSQIYHQALPVASRIYLTRVFTNSEADVFFPENWQLKEWKIVYEENPIQEALDSISTQFMIYERIN